MENRVISFTVTSFIIGLLILAGPAQGFSLNIDLDDNSPEKGQVIKFDVSVDVEAGEIVNIDELNLKLEGPENVICRFGVGGNIIGSCKGISISRIQSLSFGYGYGYGYNFGYGYGYAGEGELSYLISLDTTTYETGLYETELNVKIGNNTFSEQGEDLNINSAVNVVSNQDSGGGGGGNNRCYTQWVCGEWGACVNGQQTRVCEKEVNYCSSTVIPEQVRSCSVDFLAGETGSDGSMENGDSNAANSGNDEGSDELGENIDLSETEISWITGAVSGVMNSLSNWKVGIAAFFVFTLLIVGLVSYLRRRY